MKHVVRTAAHWALLAHIYISMAGLTLAVLFGATGLTLNHEDFGFSSPHVTTSEMTLDKSLFAHADQATIEHYLGNKLGMRSLSTDYHDDADQIQVVGDLIRHIEITNHEQRGGSGRRNAGPVFRRFVRPQSTGTV